MQMQMSLDSIESLPDYLIVSASEMVQTPKGDGHHPAPLTRFSPHGLAAPATDEDSDVGGTTRRSMLTAGSARPTICTAPAKAKGAAHQHDYSGINPALLPWPSSSGGCLLRGRGRITP